MTRRSALFGLGASAALAGFSPALAMAAHLEPGGATKHDSHWEECLAVCQACFTACNSALKHCIDQLAAGHVAYAECASLCADCVEFCVTCESMMARRSKLTIHAASACAAACASCAQACEKLGTDAVMVALGKTCRQCEASCLAMVKHLAQ